MSEDNGNDARDRSRSRDRRDEDAAPGKRLTGEAIRWNPRGFGFIKPDNGGEDVFCHVSSIKDGNMLQEGDKVEYELTYDDRRGKDRAENVTGGVQGEDRGRPPRSDGGRFGGRGGRRDYGDRRDRDNGRGYERRDRDRDNDRNGSRGYEKRDDRRGRDYDRERR